MLRTYLVALAMGATTAPQLLAETAGTDAATAAAEIQPRFDAWIESYERGDENALATVFMEDGIYAANTGQVLRGRTEIRAGVAAWMAQRPEGMTFDLSREPLRFRVSGDVAHDLARFTIRAVTPGCLVDAGHALSVWRRQPDGSWLIETLLVNQDREPPADACSRQPPGNSRD